MMSKEQAMAMVLAKYELFPDSKLKPQSVWRGLTRETRKNYHRKAAMALRDLRTFDLGPYALVIQWQASDSNGVEHPYEFGGN